MPVGEAAQHEAEVNQISAGGRESPLPARVVDLELAVWRDEGRLDGGEVGANNLGGFILVRDISTATSALRLISTVLKGRTLPKCHSQCRYR